LLDLGIEIRSGHRRGLLFWGRFERGREDRGCDGLLLEELLLAKGGDHLHLKDEEHRDVLEGDHIVDLASVEELR
jgi:hypothetical protein